MVLAANANTRSVAADAAQELPIMTMGISWEKTHTAHITRV